MFILAFASQKGGSGKTTLAGHVAIQAELAGSGPVALIDTDPQGSLSEWRRERETESPVLMERTGEEIDLISHDIRRMEDYGTKLLIIDTPPALTSTIGEVIRLSDLIVVPTRPSPHDLRASSSTVAIAKRMKKPLVFVINGATPRARVTTEAVIALSHHGPLAPAIIHQRIDFAVSMIDGRTVMELPGRSRSPGEIAALWDYLRSRLESRDDVVFFPRHERRYMAG